LRIWDSGFQPASGESPLKTGSYVCLSHAAAVLTASGLASVRALVGEIEVAEIRSSAINTGFERLGEAHIGRKREARKNDGFVEDLHGEAPKHLLAIIAFLIVSAAPL
jgi:hypothetical protein